MSNLFFNESKHRNGFQIMIETLLLLQEPRSKYRLMCLMHVTHPIITRYLELGIKYGLVQCKEKRYILSQKGRGLVEVLK